MDDSLLVGRRQPAGELAAHSADLRIGSAPPRRRSRSVSPSRSSITAYARPSWEPKSWIARMFG